MCTRDDAKSLSIAELRNPIHLLFAYYKCEYVSNRMKRAAIIKTTYYDAIDKWQSILSLCLSGYTYIGMPFMLQLADFLLKPILICGFQHFKPGKIRFRDHIYIRTNFQCIQQQQHQKNPKNIFQHIIYVRTTKRTDCCERKKKEMFKIWFVGFGSGSVSLWHILISK